MPAAVVVIIVAELLVVGVGVGAWFLAPRSVAPRILRRAAAAARASTDAASTAVPRWVVALFVVAAGYGVTIMLMWVLGRVAHALEPAVDIPLFALARDHQVPGLWTSAWQLLTLMGNRHQTQTLVVLGSVLIGLMWWRYQRPAWVPAVALGSTYVMEKYGQIVVKKAVDRGHPPTTLGTWPSGGCARLIIVYGVIVLLVLALVAADQRRRAAVVAWTIVAGLATAEAYSRTYLLKHWFTDVVGGVVYGLLLLAIAAAGLGVLAGSTPTYVDLGLDEEEPSLSAGSR